MVEIEGKQHTARLVQDYHQRPVIRVGFDVDGKATPEEFNEALFIQLRQELTPHETSEANPLPPVIELALRGQLGFKNSLLSVACGCVTAKAATGAQPMQPPIRSSSLRTKSLTLALPLET